MKHILLILMFFTSSILFAEEMNFDDIFESPTTTEAVQEVKVSFLNGKLNIENAPLNAGVEIFSMLGVSVFQEVITESQQYFLLDLKKGYYIVKIGRDTKKISVK